MKIMVLVVAFLILNCTQAMAKLLEEERFSISTTDKRATINGTILYPGLDRNVRSIPIILIGGASSSRDGYAYVRHGDPLMQEKLLYKTIAESVAYNGFAVVRFDSRGIGSGNECERAIGIIDNPLQYINGGKFCYDAVAAATSTIESKTEDILAIVNMLKNNSRLDMQNAIFLAHSEGGLHVANLIQRSLINPAGVLFLSSPADSASAIFRWQNVDRIYELIAKMIQRGGGKVSDSELAKYFALEGPGIAPPLFSGKDGWSLATLPMLRTRLLERYEQGKKIILSSPAEAGVLGSMGADINGITVSSVSHMQWFAQNGDRLVDDVAKYQGQLMFIYGQRDKLLSVADAGALVRKSLPRAKVVVIDEMDHVVALPDGHMSPQGMKAILKAVSSIAASEPASSPSGAHSGSHSR